MSDELTLKDIVLKTKSFNRFLFSKWKNIALGSVIGGLLVLAIAFIQKPTYSAQLTFALADEKASMDGFGAAAGLASQFGIDLGGANGGGAFSGDNLLILMKSRNMLEKSLLTAVDLRGKKETLADLYIDFNDLRDKWKNKPELKDIRFPVNADRNTFSLKQDSLLYTFQDDIIKKNLTVNKVEKKSSIIVVAVVSKNELFSKYFTETLVNIVSAFYIDTKTKKANQNVNILQHQTDSVRHELNLAINGVASSTDQNPNANPMFQILRTTAQHKQVDVQANQAILSELVKNLEVSKVLLRKETPLIQIIDKPILPLEKNKPSKFKYFLIGLFVGGLLMIVNLVLRSVYMKIMR
ncbi:subunit length determinant protein [Mucilaginibacter yixingensis]|uniref:Subunit length determinant protein n=1 Tax=Mucilaginibacter yixingensis TaxID=1295612 RepID=A0A2T5JGQ1_9SPHI|nr:lipopolysaccharide biosynthesis protein [Mucilaginibacter yixingensis]PTR01581.1 subunit length determinant protein [Mucilaginibacter yixingensis]